jgi:hypothetical protein
MFIGRVDEWQVLNAEAEFDSGGEYYLLSWSEDLSISQVQSGFANKTRSTIPFLSSTWKNNCEYYNFATTYPEKNG